MVHNLSNAGSRRPVRQPRQIVPDRAVWLHQSVSNQQRNRNPGYLFAEACEVKAVGFGDRRTAGPFSRRQGLDLAVSMYSGRDNGNGPAKPVW